MGSFYNNLISKNSNWASETEKESPGFFANLSSGQKPPALWIGCSDSRIPPTLITKSKPGDLFVHRNIANLVVGSDLNFLSVLEYSVNALKVNEIIICGHYGCGGVKASMEKKSIGIIDNWLSNIQKVEKIYEKDLQKINDELERYNKLVEFNVKQQVINLLNTDIVKNAWQNNQLLEIHGCVFSLESGKLHDLEVSVKNDK